MHTKTLSSPSHLEKNSASQMCVLTCWNCRLVFLNIWKYSINNRTKCNWIVLKVLRVNHFHHIRTFHWNKILHILRKRYIRKFIHRRADLEIIPHRNTGNGVLRYSPYNLNINFYEYLWAVKGNRVGCSAPVNLSSMHSVMITHGLHCSIHYTNYTGQGVYPGLVDPWKSK